MELIESVKIWDKAPHNAFTDLIRYNAHWYCAFREGQSHVSSVGNLRVIRSADGKAWSSVAFMEWEGGDVRDAKLSITSDDQLMLNGAVRFLEPRDGNRHQSVTWLSSDGENWDGPHACPSGLGTWRWSATWHNGFAYSFGYSGKDKEGCLYRSKDGKTWATVKERAFPGGEALGNETSLLFLEDDTAYCLLRRDLGADTGIPTRSGMLGRARPPYTDWEWKDLGIRIGGPKMIRLDDGSFLATVRLYDQPIRTSVCRIEPESATLTEILTLPSGGDTSYAGMVMHEGLLWISYYSSHEGKTSIYLAKVKTDP